jgi:hypothetical protein
VNGDAYGRIGLLDMQFKADVTKSPGGTRTVFGNPPIIPQRLIRRRCACGKCVACTDNARWNRIFEAKFMDRDYYTRTAVWRGSPLSALG